MKKSKLIRWKYETNIIKERLDKIEKEFNVFGLHVMFRVR